MGWVFGSSKKKLEESIKYRLIMNYIEKKTKGTDKNLKNTLNIYSEVYKDLNEKLKTSIVSMLRMIKFVASIAYIPPKDEQQLKDVSNKSVEELEEKIKSVSKHIIYPLVSTPIKSFLKIKMYQIGQSIGGGEQYKTLLEFFIFALVTTNNIKHMNDLEKEIEAEKEIYTNSMGDNFTEAQKLNHFKPFLEKIKQKLEKIKKIKNDNYYSLEHYAPFPIPGDFKSNIKSITDKVKTYITKIKTNDDADTILYFIQNFTLKEMNAFLNFVFEKDDITKRFFSFFNKKHVSVIKTFIDNNIKDKDIKDMLLSNVLDYFEHNKQKNIIDYFYDLLRLGDKEYWSNDTIEKKKTTEFIKKNNFDQGDIKGFIDVLEDNIDKKAPQTTAKKAPPKPTKKAPKDIKSIDTQVDFRLDTKTNEVNNIPVVDLQRILAKNRNLAKNGNIYNVDNNTQRKPSTRGLLNIRNVRKKLREKQGFSDITPPKKDLPPEKSKKYNPPAPAAPKKDIPPALRKKSQKKIVKGKGKKIVNGNNDNINNESEWSNIRLRF